VPGLANYNDSMDLIESVALGAGLAWASGIRLYAVLFIAGLLGRFGYLALPPALEVLTHPLVLGASGFMLTLEFLADKAPGFDTLWDSVHTFIRIPAGAFLAAAALGETDPAWIATAAIVGGAIASGSHFAKAGSRALINTSPEPFSNWAVSLGEDLLVPAGLLAAIKAPLVFLVLLVLFVLSLLWLLPKLWRGLKRMFSRLRRSPVA
jgi:Domain of unknown function (DUF4126)